MGKSRGFTLIELLVVVAVIALLMAILMPSLQRARRQAKTVACQAQLHQWGLVFSAYTGDYDGYFMQGWTGTGRHPWEQGRWIWINALRPYYSDLKMRLCPMATKFVMDENGNPTGARPPYAAYGIINRGDDYAYINGDFTSYVINWWVNRCPPGFSITWGEERQFWRNANVRGASNIPVFGDGNFWLARPRHTDPPPEFDGQWNWGDAPGAMGMKRLCVNRRDGFTNGLFMDWSIRKMGLKQLYTFKWNREFDTGGIWTTAGGVRPGDWPRWMRKFKEYY
jgi:prepilin-type N-terminal cleavage/methylation domain-containing protein